MPNVSLQPHDWGGKKVGWEQLAADVKDGILIEGDGSFSIDQQRYNFQFGGQVFWEIKNGKKTRMLRDVAYQSRHAAILGEPGHGRLLPLLQARRLLLRREGPADPNQLRLARSDLEPFPQGQRPQHREEDLSFLSDAEAKRITEKLLAAATAPETLVYLNPARSGNTRFALNEVTTSGFSETLHRPGDVLLRAAPRLGANQPAR